MMYAQGPQFCRFFVPALISVSSPDYKVTSIFFFLSALLAWIQSAPLRAQKKVERARLPITIHRHPLASGPVLPVRFVTTYGEQTLRTIGMYSRGVREMRQVRRVQVALGWTLGMRCRSWTPRR